MALSEVQEELPLEPFFPAVKIFYVKTTEKLLKKFPFSDQLLKDIAVLNPIKSAGCKPETIVNLANASLN